MNGRRWERLLNDDLARAEIVKRFEAAEKRIVAIIEKAVNSGKDAPAYYERRLAEIRQIMAVMANDLERYIKKHFPQYYDEGVSITDEIMAQYRLDKIRKSPVTSGRLQRIIDDTAQRLKASMAEGINQIDSIFRNTQQTVLSEIRVNQLLSEGIVTNDSFRQRSKILADELKRQLNGQSLVINGRNYRPGPYAELVTRTRGREAQSAGAVDNLAEYGVDTVRVSSHNTETAICQQYEGKVYSLSGNTSGLPVLPQLPPFHPNCLHVIYPHIPRGEVRTMEENRLILEELASAN